MLRIRRLSVFFLTVFLVLMTGVYYTVHSHTGLTDTRTVKRMDNRKNTDTVLPIISVSIGIPFTGYTASNANPYHNLEKMSVSTKTDYAHCITETIIQGNGEMFEIIVQTNNKKAEEKDLLLLYDEEEFKVISTDIRTSGSSPVITYRVQALQEGMTEMYLVSMYDYFEYDEDAPYYEFNVYKLDKKEGQAVYVTPTGEKYHKTARHAGENYITTTMFDAEALEMEPCGTCY